MKDLLVNTESMLDALTPTLANVNDGLMLAIKAIVEDDTRSSNDLCASQLSFEELLETLVNAKQYITYVDDTLENLHHVRLEPDKEVF